MSKPFSWNLRGRLYRMVMRLSHRFDWHYMEHCYPDRDHMIWCHWCGARYVFPRATPQGKGEGQ
jgi:hypothetical protein